VAGDSIAEDPELEFSMFSRGDSEKKSIKNLRSTTKSKQSYGSSGTKDHNMDTIDDEY